MSTENVSSAEAFAMARREELIAAAQAHGVGVHNEINYNVLGLGSGDIRNIIEYPLEPMDHEMLRVSHSVFTKEWAPLWAAAWRDAWRARELPEYSPAWDEAYMSIWVPRLETHGYGPAVWGAVVAALLQDELESTHYLVLRRPWEIGFSMGLILRSQMAHDPHVVLPRRRATDVKAP